MFDFLLEYGTAALGITLALLLLAGLIWVIVRPLDLGEIEGKRDGGSAASRPSEDTPRDGDGPGKRGRPHRAA
jgi:hypothetical protein